MRESDLRRVLLVKAIEETDRDGAVIAPADRLAASREAKRAGPTAGEELRLERARLPAAAEGLLVHRARTLLQQVRVRHPFIDEIVSFAPAAWVSIAVVLAAFAVGVGLSALDGTRRINVLAFPLWGIVAWNLLVYVLVLAAFFGRLARNGREARRMPLWAAQAAMQRLSRLVARARRFHAPLSAALARFLAEWQQAARGILAARAARLFHVAAAALGVGLIAGFYVRGIALDYQAGWESTFLDAAQARSVLRVIYAPASWITGIAIPDTAHLEAIRWREAAGGEPAAPWIHLLAATALAFVVVPRALLALAATAAVARASRVAPTPASLPAYFDEVFRDVGVELAGGEVHVVPYAYEPSAESVARLRQAVGRAHVRPMLAYGHEDAFARELQEDAVPRVALLFTLASTPEEENHGRVIDAARAAAGRGATQVDVLVDEGPYASRMGPDMQDRLDERRRAWRQFVAARGLEPRFVDLSR
ncbi:MAG TPA: DUF2868 domain-containing protein [Usitatibacter sp.]|nr:DUF2868 domain-containing protein [Usitatibacter sp.]